MTGFLGALPHELVSLALSSDDGGRTRQWFGIASTAKVVQSAVIGALADECNWDPGLHSRRPDHGGVQGLGGACHPNQLARPPAVVRGKCQGH